MPIQGTITPGSQTARLLEWLHANPGEHRPSHIARSMGEPPHPIANALGRMARNGLVQRRADKTFNPDTGRFASVLYSTNKENQ